MPGGGLGRIARQHDPAVVQRTRLEHGGQRAVVDPVGGGHVVADRAGIAAARGKMRLEVVERFLVGQP